VTANPRSDTPAFDQAGVLAVLAELERTWAAGDADAYGALHSAGASYVAFDGTVMNGPAEIADGHRNLFGGIMKNSRLAAVHRDVRFLAADLAVVVQRAGIVMSWQKGRSTPSRKRLSTNTTLLRHDGDRWSVAAFQNTRYRPWAKTLIGRLVTRTTGSTSD
jgi:uncharacterized protein (TIGR02246 family)